MALATERGLDSARRLDTGPDGNSGHLRFGVEAAVSGWDAARAFGTVDYLHHMAETPVGELSAFARGFGGVTLTRGRWTPEAGLTSGLELRW